MYFVLFSVFFEERAKNYQHLNFWDLVLTRYHFAEVRNDKGTTDFFLCVPFCCPKELFEKIILFVKRCLHLRLTSCFWNNYQAILVNIIYNLRARTVQKANTAHNDCPQSFFSLRALVNARKRKTMVTRVHVQ